MSNPLRDQLQSSLGAAYSLERELGGGGMSRVFVAGETALGRRVVVKMLNPELAEGLSAERFTREVRLAARLQHPNILALFTAGNADGVPYYTMPYVEGESLRARLDRGDTMSVADAVGILRDIARALAYAHENGIVHRDVKPENVLLSRDAAIVADFGIAKAVDAARAAPAVGTRLTQLGMAVGTPAYMAPEQASGDVAVDHRADLYAWGIVAYELLASRHPFAGKHTAQALFVAHLVETPQPLQTLRPDVPAKLISLVTQCLAKAPDERPTSARDIVDALGDLASSSGGLQPHFQSSLPSIAVLPFVNVSADPENEYFSDGISEEVLSVLAQDPGLRVAARSSSFAFKGTQVDLRTMAQRLHVTTLLEGSVRRVGNRVRISAQLVNAADGYHLWSDRYDRELTDIFAVQDEIANAIATTLGRRLREPTGASPPQSSSPQTTRRTRKPVSIEAYDEYLKGRHANRNMRGFGHETGPAHFKRALALDPEFAAAHAGLAESYFWLMFSGAFPPGETFSLVRRNARRALALDPELADAHWLLAESALWHDWDVEAAEAHVRDALVLEEHHAEATMCRAFCYNARCLKQETLATAAAAVHIDPITAGTRIWLAGLAFNVGEFELARIEAGRVIDEKPDYPGAYVWRGLAYLMKGDLVAARADLEMAGRTELPLNSWGERTIALLASRENNLVETRRIRDELVRRAARQWESPLMIGQIEQALGDYDAAFAWYERAYQARDHLLAVIHTDPSFAMSPPNREPITADPRWTDLVRRIGLAP